MRWHWLAFGWTFRLYMVAEWVRCHEKQLQHFEAALARELNPDELSRAFGAALAGFKVKLKRSMKNCRGDYVRRWRCYDNR